MESIYRHILAFGSNMGDRHENFKQALKKLQAYVVILCESNWRLTTPLIHPDYDTSDHDIYLNFVCEVRSSYDAKELYNFIVLIEDAIGHPRHRRWASRALDIDILFSAYDDALDFANCTPWTIAISPFFIPHPAYLERDFWHAMVEDELQLLDRKKRTKHYLKVL